MSQELATIARGINEGLCGHFCPTMEVGKTVPFPDGRMVKIISGRYLDPVYGRVSNWWTWQPVAEDGSLGQNESGYGW